MPLAVSSSPPNRPAQSVGLVLDRAAMHALPRLREVEIPEARLPDEPGDRCQQLWCSVILRAISDSCGIDMKSLDRETNERRPGYWKRTAREWLRRPPEMVLDMAGIAPGAWPRVLRGLEAKWARLDAERQQSRAA